MENKRKKTVAFRKAFLGVLCGVLMINIHAAPLELMVETYPLSAPNAESVLSALEAQAPKAPNSSNVILGWTQFQWGAVNLAARDTANGCAVDAVDLVGRVVTYHPRLMKAESQEWASRFEQFANSVRQHEHKHVQVYATHWATLEIELAQQWAKRTHQMTCSTLRNVLERRLSEWDRNTAADHQQLDASEGHFGGRALRAAFGLN